MGNLVGKLHNDKSKTRKRKDRRSNRDKEGRRNRGHRRHHGKKDDYARSRVTAYPETRGIYFNKCYPALYDPYYSHSSANRHLGYGWHGFSPGPDPYRPSTGGSVVSSVPNNLPCMCHARFGVSSRCPASVPSAAPPSGIQRPLSGSRLHYRSSRLNKRAVRRLSHSEADESTKIRGMVVYKNGKEEKMKMLDDDEKSSRINLDLKPRINERNKNVPDYVFTKTESITSKDESSRKSSGSRKCNRKINKQKFPLSDQEQNSVTEPNKKTIFGKFWDSPLGKKLPIGGPLSWFRRPQVLPPLSENSVENPLSKPVATNPKTRGLWNGIKRRFLWKSVSRKRPSSHRHIDRESDAVMNISPRNMSAEPGCPSRRAPSRQFVWKTASTPINHISNNEIDVIDCSPVAQDVVDLSYAERNRRNEPELEEVILPNLQRRQRSPFFSSKYTWRSPNTHDAKQAWGHGGSSKDNNVNSTTKSFNRSYLWRKNEVAHCNGGRQKSWFDENDEATLYHH